jgi:hypothetical protein
MTACGDEIADEHLNIYLLHYKMQIRLNCFFDNEKLLNNGGEVS